MRVAIDLSWLPPRPAGAARYALELLDGLSSLPDDGVRFVVFSPPGALDRSAARADQRFVIDEGLPRSRAARIGWEQAVLPLRLRKDRPDVLHVPHSQAPLLTSGVPVVVTFHDVTYEIFGERYPWLRRTYYRAAARIARQKAGLAIAVSECVAGDLVQRLGLERPGIRVIPEAAGRRFTPATRAQIEDVRRRYALGRRYVLSVGSIEPGKGRESLSAAMRALRADGFEHDLVVAGQTAWGVEARPDGARYLGYVPDEDLPALYSGCDVFAFPSLYEGFGLPLLEAMACGAPVVATSSSAIPEVAGDAALLVTPGSPPSLADGLRQVLEDEEARRGMIERGLSRAACFSWRETATKTLEVYREAARSSRGRG
ncbi:MAG: glycosyltransferase [Dehalococcoidia bacterium]|nr:glycosyltransferase [Dehalococcoidia bacterium]